MSDNTGIEWTDATWSPIIGCDRVSPGCDHCYAITAAHIRTSNPNPKVSAAFAGTTERRDGRIDWTGRVNLLPDRLDQPLRWKKPRRIFVNSMSDLFHKDVPDEFIARVFAIMGVTPRHTFQILTKRPARMRSLLSSDLFRRQMYDALVSLDYEWINANRLPWPLPNVWLGCSVENQQWADIRIPALLDTPAAVRFLSCEPLLGPIDLRRSFNGRHPDAPMMPLRNLLHWVIVGGESGRAARPMHPDWARSLRDQCQTAGVAFLFKQWGEYAPVEYNKGFLLGGDGRPVAWSDGDTPACLPDGCAVVARVGKKAAGREVDGRTWDEYPDSKPHAEIASSR